MNEKPITVTFGSIVTELALQRSRELSEQRSREEDQRKDKAAGYQDRLQILIDICSSAVEENPNGFYFFEQKIWITDQGRVCWPNICSKEQHYRAQPNKLVICLTADGEPSLQLHRRDRYRSYSDSLIEEHTGPLEVLAPVLISYLADMIRHR